MDLDPTDLAKLNELVLLCGAAMRRLSEMDTYRSCAPNLRELAAEIECLGLEGKRLEREFAALAQRGDTPAS